MLIPKAVPKRDRAVVELYPTATSLNGNITAIIELTAEFAVRIAVTGIALFTRGRSSCFGLPIFPPLIKNITLAVTNENIYDISTAIIALFVPEYTSVALFISSMPTTIMTVSSRSSVALYGKKFFVPQKTPLSSAYTELKINAGAISLNRLRHLVSANKNDSFSVNNIEKIKIGTASNKVINIPAVITEFWRFWLPSARYLLIKRETVIGIPEEHTVKSNAKTDSVIWYKPMPSDPIVRERYILYIKPKNFSAIAKIVTISTD